MERPTSGYTENVAVPPTSPIPDIVAPSILKLSFESATVSAPVAALPVFVIVTVFLMLSMYSALYPSLTVPKLKSSEGSKEMPKACASSVKIVLAVTVLLPLTTLIERKYPAPLPLRVSPWNKA